MPLIKSALNSQQSYNNMMGPILYVADCLSAPCKRHTHPFAGHLFAGNPQHFARLGYIKTPKCYCNIRVR